MTPKLALVGVAVQALLVGAAVLGPAESLEVAWDAPAECPGGSAVQASFERHAKGGHTPLEARGTVTREGDLYVLELELISPTGAESRRIEATTCDALAETAGLLSAVASEPALVPKPVEPSEPAPEPPPRLEPAPTPAPRPQPSPRTSERAPPEPDETFPLGLVVRADALAQALRLLPRVFGGGVVGAVGVRGQRWRVEARGQYLLPQPRDYADVVVGGSFDLWTLGVAGCWEPAVERLSFPLCAGFEAGSLRGRTRDVEQPGSAGAFFGGGTADGALVFAPIPRVGLRAGVGGVVSVRRPEYHVRGQRTLFKAGIGALRAALGVEVRFL